MMAAPCGRVQHIVCLRKPYSDAGLASRQFGVSQRMIRHYEGIGLIPRAPRRDSGYRDYDNRDVHTIRFIRRARDLGFPIEEFGKLARVAELKRKEKELSTMRRAL